MSENSLPGQAAAPKPFRRSVWLLWLGVAAFAYVCDQLTKWWVSSTMEIGEKTPVIPGVLQWYHILNSGAAFSIGENFTWVFSIIMAAVAVIIIVLFRRISSIWWAIGLGLVLGGALGNLTDRLFRPPSFGMGHVVDFISFPNFAIFNMADMAVVGGVIAICVLTLLGIGMDGSRHTGADTATDADTSTAADTTENQGKGATND
ncbi:MAG: signal peptidase II [Specibacter sp.]